MDAINSLGTGARRAQATFDAAAQQLAAADLPTAKNPDPTNPVSPSPPVGPEVDVAAQLVTMTVAADMHHITTAALRSAFSLYRESIDLIRPGGDVTR
ncbi:MAG TPA: hypothetical protein VGP92_09070 [Acidimicrobiia bacterium]|nr:hypothetical protein [Acidimicrobiia bacterium]